ncbi:MAG: Rieske (2Fe-2S) protein [Planctomycetota bacterium]|jgi:nitrite reductase/ring-hydroxylating ferredoxin subunit|nr:Rieske (2Fe-2S) protein [Planctomycetota bacterium]MDP6762664.1 Rieske (2Fe-2S) protein [Planctomycetota bacterium]MDP6989973.1 Rieske (2Fe-2S) protein [Planctomycetota bacterium]
MSSEHAPNEEDWHALVPLAELEIPSLAAFKLAGHQLAAGRTADGAPFAVDNRCPHEGYPLATGYLADCSLTCAWHNWKFDVRDGACTLGGEGVRAFCVRVREGIVEVDLAEPDFESAAPKLLESFAEGVLRHENGRAIRDGVRLLEGGFDPWRLLAELAALDARHAEYGTTHVLAVAADCGRVLTHLDGVEAMRAIAPVIDLCGEANRRLPRRPIPQAVTGCDEASLLEAVESEDAARAEGLLRGAFETGVERATIEGWMYAALARHFTSFGHHLIYMVKGQELTERVDESYAADLYGSLLHSIVLGTREDTLPYWEGHARRLGAVKGELASLFESAADGAELDPLSVSEAVLDGSVDEAFEAILDPLERGVGAARLARALVGAAAERLLRFDVAHEQDPLVAENWLWATHRFTFACAVRHAVERWRRPDSLRLLFQSAAFTHTGRAMDLEPAARCDPKPRESDAGEILAAIASRRPEEAVARVRGFLRAGRPLESLQRGLEELCLRDIVVRPIVVAHVIKTCFAALEETVALEGHPHRELPLCAVARMLASPLAERRVEQLVTTSIRWVVGGHVPRKLTQ